MKTNNHEVIFAIVNSGFAEDVMDVAREQGARGGTILSGRGVAREDPRLPESRRLPSVPARLTESRSFLEEAWSGTTEPQRC